MKCQISIIKKTILSKNNFSKKYIVASSEMHWNQFRFNSSCFYKPLFSSKFCQCVLKKVKNENYVLFIYILYTLTLLILFRNVYILVQKWDFYIFHIISKIKIKTLKTF